MIDALILAVLQNQDTQEIEEPKAQVRAVAIASRTKNYVSYAKAKINNKEQFECLNLLFEKESNWRTKKDPQYAENPNSSAYGIPQALPGNKMAEAGHDWEHNPITQIKWALSYIEKRYETPCKAWQHSQKKGWY